MDSKIEKEYTYFQYYKDLNIPIFIKLSLAEFEIDMASFLNEICFSQLTSQEFKKFEESVKDKSKIKVLRLSEATPSVAHNIHFLNEGDLYGLESISYKKNYKIYRYKGISIGIFSVGAREWELGCFSNFGVSANRPACVTVINRFLSWAMSPSGVVGFWGVPVDEGVVVMSQQDAKGEAVFFDLYKNVVYTLDGVKKIGPNFVVMRLDRILRNRNIKMSSSELASFLAVNCCYFDTDGLSLPIRQMIRTISLNISGLIHPKDNFKPRTDLSL
ncbi:MAG: hypothetical protein A2202_09055 [Bdellovibrionales bacterium RIFOXYA1_FULL_36_14]|nr:MAG: hypothetical protein A2202_09055 [Bdellovibrionales bacterium RIFOXYA1_FULL_36_14]